VPASNIPQNIQNGKWSTYKGSKAFGISWSTMKDYVARYFSPTDNDEVKSNLDSVVKHKNGRPIASSPDTEIQSVKYIKKCRR
jgi:hypothetical protein